MPDIFLAALPLFLIIAFGALLRRLRMADESWTDILNRFALYAAFPAMIVGSLVDPQAGAAVLPLKVLLVNMALLFVVLFGLYALLRILKIDTTFAAAVAVCGFYGNIAYLGMPFITSVIPGSGAQVALHIALYVFILFTGGLMLLERATGRAGSLPELMLAMLKNPLFAAVLIGLCLHFLQIPVPAALRKTLSFLGGSASPTVLLGLGIFIGRGLSGGRTLARAGLLTAVKIVLLPAVFLLTGYFLFPGEAAFRVSILEAAMPVGLTAFALTQAYPLDREAVAQAVVLSTLLSMITLPVLAGIILP